MTYKVLVAEDVPAERAALCSILNQHLGHTITLFQASDGAEALSLFYKEEPDIAILNIEMPQLSGLNVAKQIRESQKNCVFFLSVILTTFLMQNRPSACVLLTTF